jgi:hypothetical protein
MKKLPLLVVVLLVAGSLAQESRAKEHPYRGPLCLGGFCFGSSLPSEKKLVAQYGPGSRVGEFRCYAAPDQKAFVYFLVEHELPGEILTIFVSDAPNCVTGTKLPPPKTPFPAFETKAGIRLDASYDQVIKTYGQPDSTRDGTDGVSKIVPFDRGRKGSPFGETALVYNGPSNELIQGIFYLRKGRVAAIYISRSE